MLSCLPLFSHRSEHVSRHIAFESAWARIFVLTWVVLFRKATANAKVQHHKNTTSLTYTTLENGESRKGCRFEANKRSLRSRLPEPSTQSPPTPNSSWSSALTEPPPDRETSRTNYIARANITRHCFHNKRTRSLSQRAKHKNRCEDGNNTEGNEGNMVARLRRT